MALNGILSLIAGNGEYRRHLELLDSGGPPPQITVRQGGRPGYIAALWRHRNAPLLVITPRPEDARRLHDQLLTYVGEGQPVYLLPEPEVLPFERLAVDANTGNQRLAALAALADVKLRPTVAGRPNPLVVASVGAALRKTVTPETMVGNGTDDGQPGAYRVSVGQRLRLNTLLAQWVNLGYRNEPLVESAGSFSRRGGIIDVFPPNAELPFRIEMWDDQVDTIRAFDPYSQRSVDPVEEVRIIAAREQLPGLACQDSIQRLTEDMDFSQCSAEVRDRMDEELANLFADSNAESLSFYNGLLNQSSLLDYLPQDGLVVMERSSRIEAEAQDLEERFSRMRAGREGRGELPALDSLLRTWNGRNSTAAWPAGPRIELNSWVSGEDDRIFQPAVPYYGRLEQLASDARRHQRAGNSVVAVTQHARRLAEILEGAGVGVSLRDVIDDPPPEGVVYLASGSLQEGWALNLPSPTGNGASGGDDGRVALVLLTDGELFGTVKERRYRRTGRSRQGPEVALADLTPGTYVVHIDHGVARFHGDYPDGPGRRGKGIPGIGVCRRR